MINQDYLKVGTGAAKQSAKIFNKFFGKPKNISSKSQDPRNLVTEVDLDIETQIRKYILKRFPTHKFIGEEFGTETLEKNDFVWIIDPIDGTTNYIQGFPVCCISIALWDKHGPLVGVVYNPILKQLFTAIRGQGAFLNGKKIKTSSVKLLQQSYGGYGWSRNVDKASKNFPILVKTLNKIRTIGSCTLELCLVAMGVYDFYVQAQINVWDFAAAVLILTEAGGKATDWTGKKIGMETVTLTASNPYIHNQLLKITKII